MTRLISARAATRATSIPWRELRPILEQRDTPLFRIGNRIRVPEDAIHELIRDCRVLSPTEEKKRAALVEQLAAEAVLGEGSHR